MKKTFPLTHPKIKPARLADSIRAEISKYIKRERRKELPEGVDFWDFDCKVGADAASADEQHISAVSKAIGQVLEEGNDTVYVEIIAKPATRNKPAEPAEPAEPVSQLSQPSLTNQLSQLSQLSQLRMKKAPINRCAAIAHRSSLISPLRASGYPSSARSGLAPL